MDTVRIRASSLGELFDCGMKWEARHVLNMQLPTSISAHFGTSIHAGTGLWDQAGIDNLQGTTVTEDDAFEAFEGALTNPEREVDWGDETPETLIPAGRDLIHKYITEIAPSYRYAAVEAMCEPLVLDDLGLELTGSADRVYIDADGKYGIVDLKTGKTAVGSDGRSHAQAHRAQLGCYELLVGASLGIQLEAPAVVIGLQNAKTAKGRRVGTSTTEGCMSLLIGDEFNAGLLTLASRIVHSGVFYPNASSPLCSEKYCPRYGICPYHR